MSSTINNNSLLMDENEIPEEEIYCDAEKDEEGPIKQNDETHNHNPDISKDLDSNNGVSNNGADRNLKAKDKRDRATVEKVLEPTTKMIVFKLFERRFISKIYGCISAGKEAKVFHAASDGGKHFALKVYKTQTEEFKNRDNYTSSFNPPKVAQTRAEKEFGKLKLMYSNDLNVPEPILLKTDVLLMSFIGKKGVPAPKLKDVTLSVSKSRELYRDVIISMWKMYHKCKLVHADLSEYNIMLYHNGEVFIIDVSQSVEHDHQQALSFLRTDITNATELFKKKGVATLDTKKLFDFVTNHASVEEEKMEKGLAVIISMKAAEKNDPISIELVSLILKQRAVRNRNHQ